MSTTAAVAAVPEREGDKNAGGEGAHLLGSPTFMELQNGRFKCVETGHEMLARDMDSYSRSKRCRLGLIDFALSRNRPPLSMFNQDPLCRSKLICKLTGDTVNKSEEHIWKHINGRRFLNKLEQKEAEKLARGDLVDEVGEKPSKTSKQKKNERKNKQNKKGQKSVEEIVSEVRESPEKDSDLDEADFWMPPVGDRWDFDDGGDRWGSGGESAEESDEETDGAGRGMISEEYGLNEAGDKDSEEISARTKRMAIEVGPSSYATRKKKSRKNPTG